ncbi:MAG: sce7725 family protein [Paludibacteraceae bacterium]|nr:sce7725 family protein [Paludibacteraceae bacterium]
MYYPFLRGKQFELLALREFSEIYSDNCKIFPIIEPVSDSFNSLKIACKKFNDNKFNYAIVLNPQVGGKKGKIKDIESELEEYLHQDNCYVAFIISNDLTITKVLEHIKSKSYNNVLIICDRSVDSSSSVLDELFSLDCVKKVLIDDNNRNLKRKLKLKEVIRFDDKFKPQNKNADYLAIPEEKFTEEHSYYSDENFSGFADYTVLASEYTEGGMLPYAVAIHLTYKKNDTEIWIRHFVSDTNDDRSNIQGKFSEAAGKAVSFFRAIPYTNSAIDELNNYYDNGQYPGLGVLKKISIKSHLELVNSLL